jgi:hypothetical protein
MGRRTIAIDWSGRGGSDQRRYIWLCEVADGRIERLERGRTRAEIVEHLVGLAEEDPTMVVGLDFAFSVPAWYIAKVGLASARELWRLLAEERLTAQMKKLGLRAWIQAPEWPFWRTRKPDDLDATRAFRRTEIEAVAPGTQPKSVFQLVGGGQVGPGSLYGMQALHELSQHGFSIWPFDEPSGPVAVEIFPRTLSGPVVKSDPIARATFLANADITSEHASVAAATEDAFDALISALSMATEPDAFNRLRLEPEYALEGKIWNPSAGLAGS